MHFHRMIVSGTYCRDSVCVCARGCAGVAENHTQSHSGRLWRGTTPWVPMRRHGLQDWICAHASAHGIKKEAGQKSTQSRPEPTHTDNNTLSEYGQTSVFLSPKKRPMNKLLTLMYERPRRSLNVRGLTRHSRIQRMPCVRTRSFLILHIQPRLSSFPLPHRP